MQHNEFQEQNNLPAQFTNTSEFLNALQRASTIGETGGSMQQVALALVAGGWPVFPCGQDKAPLIDNGFKGRSADAEQVRRWWRMYPDAMAGIVPGDGGFAALDVDSEDAARAIQARGISLDSGFVVLTGGTSAPFSYECAVWLPRHIYARVDEQPRIQNVVARYLGGYVIAPGSRRGDRIYAVSSCDEPAQWAGGAEMALPKASVARSGQEPPDLQRVREAVACIPNNSNTDRDAYVLMAHLIKGSAGEAGRDIFLQWAAKWEGDVDSAEDARVWDTLGEPIVGWDALLRRAANFGFDPRPQGHSEVASSVEELATVCLADVEREPVEWLWPGYILYGKLTILDGDPGMGKSTLLLDIAARVSAGAPMPNGSICRPGGVLLLTAEDGLGDTVRPRLEAAGADLTRVAAICADKLPSLPESVESIKKKILEIEAKLVVIDPLSDYFSRNQDPYVDQDCRAALTPLSRVAAETGAAIVLIRHITKSGNGPAIHRGGGSIGMIAVARIGLIVVEDPDDEEGRVLAVAKCNLGHLAPSLAFHLESVDENIGKIIWDGESPHSANALVAASRENQQSGEGVCRQQFLRALLSDGPKHHAEVVAEYRRAGFNVSEKTIQRDGDKLGVIRERSAWGGPMMWSLPQDVALIRNEPNLGGAGASWFE